MKASLPVLVLAVYLVPFAAAAQLVVPTEPGDGASASPLSVRNQHVEVEVDSQVARTTVVQVFENHTDRDLEGTYLFALPDRAAVSGFATWVDGVRVESRVEEKAQAKKTYEKAAAAGRAPGLLERLGPGVFRTRVEGIPSGGTKRTELAYSEVLPYQDGEVSLRVPLKVDGLEAPTIRDFRVRVRIGDRTKRIARVWSTSHEVAVRRIDDRHVEVRLAEANVVPDRDLVLRYAVESDDLGLTFLAHRDGDEDGYFLLSIAPQELTTAADIVKKDVVFVFDTSGSMDGAKIAQARSALDQCLGLLNGGDAFSVVGFSDGLNPWKRRVVPATPENLDDAHRFVDHLSAGGGTDIGGALSQALDILEDRGRPRVVVFFTDGDPTVGETNPDRIVAAVGGKNVAGTRLFTFGVAAGVNRRLLDALARENRGVSEYVEPGQAIDEVVAGFYSKISKPVLADIDFAYDPVTVAWQYPSVMPDIYKGQQLLVVGRYRGAGEGQVVLSGTLNGKRRTFETKVAFPAAAPEDGFVARIWAQRRVQFLLDEMRLKGEQAEMREEVVALGKRFHLVTPYTSMVTVPQPALARLSPSRIKPGDPEVLVPAPRDARSVTVHLSFGLVRRARWDAHRGAWVARFLVPTDVPDGVYPVRVVIVHSDGSRERLALHYTVDTRAPVMAVEAPPSVRAGEVLVLRARPRVDLLAVAQAVEGGAPGAATEIAKTFADVKYVSATLWDGREVELGLSADEGGWSAEIETPRDLAPGAHTIRVTAVDWAGNLHRQRVEVRVEGARHAAR